MNEDLVIKKFQESEKEEFKEPTFWEKVAEVAKKAGVKVIYPALLLYYVMKAESTSAKDKTIIAGALAYFVSPVDIIPDVLPGIGFADDLVILLFVLKIVRDNITDEIKSQAKAKLGDWFKTIDENQLNELIN